MLTVRPSCSVIPQGPLRQRETHPDLPLLCLCVHFSPLVSLFVSLYWYPYLPPSQAEIRIKFNDPDIFFFLCLLVIDTLLYLSLIYHPTICLSCLCCDETICLRVTCRDYISLMVIKIDV